MIDVMFHFLCDHMLMRLGRWLRAAGYDTKIIESGIPDHEILEIAIKENRMLLTRDRHFLNMNAPKNSILYFKANSLNECASILTNTLHLDWLHQPLSRCLICNTPLILPNENLVQEQAPHDIRTEPQNYHYCALCNKVYWEGSHTKRILKQLHTWQKEKEKL